MESRLITLSDGTEMSDELIVIRTNAPAYLLRQLETESCEAYTNEEDIPLWWKVLEDQGYEYKVIDSCRHITPYLTSRQWLSNHKEWKHIEEHYYIEII